MGSHTRVPKAELTGIYGWLVRRMSRKMLGDVPEPVEVAWHNRKVLNFTFSVGRKVQKWDKCDENLKSFAHLAVASLVGCSFCLDLGYFQAHNEGLDTAYRDAFGARVVHCVGEGDDIVAQLAVGDAMFWVAAAGPDIGRFSPKTLGGGTSRTLLVVDDPDFRVRAGRPEVIGMLCATRA